MNEETKQLLAAAAQNKALIHNLNLQSQFVDKVEVAILLDIATLTLAEGKTEDVSVVTTMFLLYLQQKEEQLSIIELLEQKGNEIVQQFLIDYESIFTLYRLAGIDVTDPTVFNLIGVELFQEFHTVQTLLKQLKTKVQNKFSQ